MRDREIRTRPAGVFILQSSPCLAQRWLRNAGQLVRIGPSLGMADFISNSAISLPIRASAVLAAAPNSGPGRPKMADFTLKSAILRQVDRGGLVA